ncbi:MAG: sigma-70 family RNA polymerase sigma factor [Bacteroidota bacterium]
MTVRKLVNNTPDFTTKEGFNALYYQHSVRAFEFLMRKLKNKSQAMDLLQDVFADIWHRRYNIDVKISMESYIITICKYKLIDHYKAQLKLSEIKDSQQTELFSSSPEDGMIFMQKKTQMLAAFKKMPTKTKRIFLLSRRQGLSNKEIAKDLSVSEKTVEYHISKILKKLKTFIFIFF